ncbi:MAG: hypothetical protein VKJ04_06165 [Vampirovibrionales bacterium]|nr:hypothetical protein [Vampirovibrionales bacterium]
MTLTHVALKGFRGTHVLVPAATKPPSAAEIIAKIINEPDLAPEHLDGLTKCLNARYPERNLRENTQQVEQFWGVFGKVEGRVKSQAASLSKLLSRRSDWDGRTVKGTPIETAKVYGDAIGIRLTMSEGTPAQVDEVVAALADAIKRGDIQILIGENYTGKGGHQYLRKKHFTLLERASKEAGHPPFVGTRSSKESGYTAGQFNVIFKNGDIGELQLRGPHVDTFSQVEHLLYDIRMGKDVTHGIARDSGLHQEVQALQVKLRAIRQDPRLRQIYSDYINESYKRARQREIYPDNKRLASENIPFPEALAKLKQGYEDLEISKITDLHHRLEDAKAGKRVLANA